MEIIQPLMTWRHIRQSLGNSYQIGFVATMGNLHQGHATLLRKAVKENDKTVLSIYINPTQFNNSQDFRNYPLSLEEDLALAKNCGVDYVIMPQYNEIYPDDFNYQVITQHPLSKIMEGAYRPSHFTGVLTVVLKLLMLIKPHKTYFGEKDYQQLRLVQGLANAFFLDTQVIGCPTVRDEFGLALSSRNNRLSLAEKQQATLLNQILRREQPLEKSQQQLEQLGFVVDYVAEYDNRIFAAATLNQVRLIDNIEKS